MTRVIELTPREQVLLSSIVEKLEQRADALSTKADEAASQRNSVALLFGSVELSKAADMVREVSRGML